MHLIPVDPLGANVLVLFIHYNVVSDYEKPLIIYKSTGIYDNFFKIPLFSFYVIATVNDDRFNWSDDNFTSTDIILQVHILVIRSINMNLLAVFLKSFLFTFEEVLNINLF